MKSKFKKSLAMVLALSCMVWSVIILVERVNPN